MRELTEQSEWALWSDSGGLLAGIAGDCPHSDGWLIGR